MNKTSTPHANEAMLLQLLAEQIEQNRALREQLQQLQHQLATLQSMLFGQKSERKRKPTDNETSTTNPPAGTTISSSIVSSSNKADAKNGRRQLPPELERIKIRYDLPEAKKQCPCCESKLQCIGKEVSEQLDFIPAKLIAKEHIRYKYACQRCRQYMVTATMPEQPIDKGLAGSGLLAEILINKYEDALPLYRQQQRWARLGYELPRSTLCDWVMQVASRLKPIVDAMTTVCLLPARKLHTDAYPGYDKLYQSGKIIEVACFAHARRKFTDVAKSVKEPTLANQAIDMIGELYAIEKNARPMNTQQRYFYRRRFAKPILKKLYRWLIEQNKTAPPKTPLGLAIQYALNHWKALNNYLLDGILDIDNNRAERAIKPFVIGRKNFLFAGSHFGAEMAAVIYSLIASCKMLNINTFDYFNDVLQRLPTTLNKNISSLFPCYWNPLT